MLWLDVLDVAIYIWLLFFHLVSPQCLALFFMSLSRQNLPCFYFQFFHCALHHDSSLMPSPGSYVKGESQPKLNKK